MRLLNDEDLITELLKSMDGNRGLSTDEITKLLTLVHEQRAARDAKRDAEIAMLNAHLSYMAGQYEGMTGSKSAYLLENWPVYAQLSTPTDKPA